MSPDFRGPDGRARNPEYRNVGLQNSLKRKLGEDERGGRDDGFDRQRQQLLQYGNVSGPGPSVGYDLGRGDETRAAKNMKHNEGSSSKLRHSEVDQNALKVAFLHFVKLVFETANQKKSFLMDGKQGPLPCLACGRSDDVLSLRLQLFVLNSLPFSPLSYGSLMLLCCPSFCLMCSCMLFDIK